MILIYWIYCVTTGTATGDYIYVMHVACCCSIACFSFKKEIIAFTHFV